MKKLHIILAAALLLFPAFLFAQMPTEPLEGYWKGALDLGTSQLGIGFNIIKVADSTYVAKMDVPAQGAAGITSEEFKYNGFEIRVVIEPIRAVFEGMTIMGIISGKFIQNGVEIPLVLAKGEPEVMSRPQTPKEPFPYEAREVTFTNTRDNIKLAGTLTVPQGDGPFPAVILVTGSGAQNRDEELFGHRPFAVIADHLTRNGIAVLRYDDRGVGGSDQGSMNADTEDFSYDAQAAVEFLRKAIKCSKVGVIGHSEGGSIAFMLGQRKVVDFVVSLAGPAVKGSEILFAQQEALLKASRVSQPLIDQNHQMMAGLYEIVDKSESLEGMIEEIKKYVAMMPGDTQEKILSQIGNEWMRFFIKYDPTQSIVDTKCPVIAFDGTKDLQVISSQNIPAFEKIIADHGKTNIILHEMPDLNHLFQHAKTGLPNEYGTISETFSPEVLTLITDFITDITKK